MLIVGMLVKNEADRYLKQALIQINKVADKVIILDDNSTDNTKQVIYDNIDYKKIKYRLRKEDGFVKNESNVRKELWKMITREAEHHDWIMILDADEILTDNTCKTVLKNIELANKTAEKTNINALSFRFYDMWSGTHYREDHLWNAHKRPFVPLIKYDSKNHYLWSTEKLHCGRFPWNAVDNCMLTNMEIQHMGYADEEDREKKYQSYLELDPEGTYGIMAQYVSILDEHPNLVRFKKTRILIGAPVRIQHEWELEAFRRYLESLRNLKTYEDMQVDKLFIFNGCNKALDYKGLLGDFEDFIEIDNDEQYGKNNTHEWTDKNIYKMSQMRNIIIQHTLIHGYDYYFSIDSDLVLHPQTLLQLFHVDEGIVANIFWTKWTPDSDEQPNAWEFDSFSFMGGYDKYRTPGTFECGGTGACKLVKRAVLEDGINYDMIPNLTIWGEDRHFCIRAAVKGHKMFIDTTYPAKHLYREVDLNEIQSN